MRKMLNLAFRAAVLALLATLVACPNPIHDGSSALRGTVEILLTDFPLEDAQVSAVRVRILNVAICDATEEWRMVADFGPGGVVYDLLTLVDDVASLGFGELPVGAYSQIRLLLGADHEIDVNEGFGVVTRELRIPSGEQTGIKLSGDFRVETSGVTRIVLDFDARHSIARDGKGRYFLKPVILIKEVRTRSFLVNDGFETYAAGSYPSAWGWYPLWSGSEAKVSEAQARLGTRSFMLSGYTGWVRADGIDMNLADRALLAYRASIMIPGGSPTGAHIGFFLRTSGNTSVEFNSLALNPGFEIGAYGTEWRSTGVACSSDTWYDLRVEIDFASNSMDVWLDGLKVIEDLPAHERTSNDVFFVGTGWSGSVYGISTVYVDAIQVF